MGTSLAVQWLRVHASTAGGMGLIPGQGTKIPHAVRCAVPTPLPKKRTIIASTLFCLASFTQ